MSPKGPRHPMRIPIPSSSRPSRLLVQCQPLTECKVRMDHQTIDSNDQSVSIQGRKMEQRDRRYIGVLPHHVKLYVMNQLATGLVTRSERLYICMQVITNLFEGELWSRDAEEIETCPCCFLLPCFMHSFISFFSSYCQGLPCGGEP